MERKTIKHVDVYLKKSRDDGEFEDVLSKHRDTLLAMVENRNWTYRLYEEMASGEKDRIPERNTRSYFGMLKTRSMMA